MVCHKSSRTLNNCLCREYYSALFICKFIQWVEFMRCFFLLPLINKVISSVQWIKERDGINSLTTRSHRHSYISRNWKTSLGNRSTENWRAFNRELMSCLWTCSHSAGWTQYSAYSFLIKQVANKILPGKITDTASAVQDVYIDVFTHISDSYIGFSHVSI